MTDMGPRRMDGFGRTATRPTGAPQPQLRPQPQPRPQVQTRVQPAAPVRAPRGSQSQPEPVRRAMPQPRPLTRPEQAPQRQQQREQEPAASVSSPKKQAKRQLGGWSVVLQFIIGLLVIAGVAAAIVALYIRYYQ